MSLGLTSKGRFEEPLRFRIPALAGSSTKVVGGTVVVAAAAAAAAGVVVVVVVDGCHCHRQCQQVRASDFVALCMAISPRSRGVTNPREPKRERRRVGAFLFGWGCTCLCVSVRVFGLHYVYRDYGIGKPPQTLKPAYVIVSYCTVSYFSILFTMLYSMMIMILYHSVLYIVTI